MIISLSSKMAVIGPAIPNWLSVLVGGIVPNREQTGWDKTLKITIVRINVKRTRLKGFRLIKLWNEFVIIFLNERGIANNFIMIHKLSIQMQSHGSSECIRVS